MDTIFEFFVRSDSVPFIWDTIDCKNKFGLPSGIGPVGIPAFCNSLITSNDALMSLNPVLNVDKNNKNGGISIRVPRKANSIILIISPITLLHFL